MTDFPAAWHIGTAATPPAALRWLTHHIQLSQSVNASFAASTVPLLHLTLDDALSAAALVPAPANAAAVYFTQSSGGGAATPRSDQSRAEQSTAERVAWPFDLLVLAG